LRAPVLAAAAYSSLLADDSPLAQRLAGQVLAEPAPGDPLISGWIRGELATIYANTAQPERAIGLAREGRQEAAERGIDFHVGFLLAAEAQVWTRTGDYAAARQPAMEAVEIARRVRNPALSAYASWVAAAAI
jgi:hypothetical protein